jgi:hypothetical protein
MREAACILGIAEDARRHLVHLHQMRAAERRRAPGVHENSEWF